METHTHYGPGHGRPVGGYQGPLFMALGITFVIMIAEAVRKQTPDKLGDHYNKGNSQGNKERSLITTYRSSMPGTVVCVSFHQRRSRFGASSCTILRQVHKNIVLAKQPSLAFSDH